MDSLPSSSAVAVLQLPPRPAFARPWVTAILAARMSYLSSQAVGKFSRASARATAAFREFLVHKFGREGEIAFSKGLLTDGALVAGSSVLACSLIRSCSWEAGDLDIWAPSKPSVSGASVCRELAFRSTAAFLDKISGLATSAVGSSDTVALSGTKRPRASVDLDETRGWNALELQNYDLALSSTWDGPLPIESAMVHSVVERTISVPIDAVLVKGAAPHTTAAVSYALLDVQLIESAFPHSAAVVHAFDLTRCMAAYDGESVWALAADLDAEGELLSPSSTAINRLRLTDASYWQLLRTRRRITKYAERGIQCDEADVKWLEAAMKSHVHSAHSLIRACAYGRFQEACALIRAGADHSRVTGSALRVYNVSAPCFNTGQGAGVKGGDLDDFRALLEDFVAVHASPRALAARAAVTSARVSKGFSAQVLGMARDSSCIVAQFVSGYAGGSLLEAKIDEQASNQSQGAQKAAKARVKAIKRALPPLALSEGRGLLIGYDEYGIDDE